MEKVTFTATKIMFGLMMGLIILLILFFQSSAYICKVDFLLSNLTILAMLAGLFFLCAVVYYAKRPTAHSLSCKTIDYDKAVKIVTPVLFCAQIYIFYNAFFLTGWDVGVIRDSARCLVSGNVEKFMNDYGNYHSDYPNNLLILYLNTFLLQINDAVGIFSGEYAMMSGVVVNCLINSVACYLVYHAAIMFTERKYAFLGYCLVVLSVGISPWTIIFYSDAVGLMIPILTFYLYVKPSPQKAKRYIYRFCAVLAAVIGYFIKPQCAIMLIAIVVIETAYLLDNFKPKKMRRLVCLAASCVVCFFAVSQSINWLNEKTGITLDQERTLGLTHFFMMGMNETRGGVYSTDDVVFSRSFATAQERSKANLDIAFARLADMGPGGYIKHLSKKMLTTFHDGTFAWSQEGTFYKQIPEDLNNKVSPFLKSVYYSDGELYPYFSLFEQIIWIVILLLTFASGFIGYQRPERKHINILWLSLSGLILFECLFEVRARYLYTFVPVFCILAALGLKLTREAAKSAIESLFSGDRSK